MSIDGDGKCILCNSGAESVEAAIKIARKFGHDNNHSNPKIIVMSNSFHGRTMGAMSATANTSSHEAFGPVLDGLIRVKFNEIEEVNQALKNHSDVSAILLEPVQGEGGIIPCDNFYLQQLREICSKNSILLMIDEVQSGFCRTGKWFSYQHSNIQPDVVMVAKALGNGVPIGACLATGPAAHVLKAGMHGSTFGGNFLSTSVGLRVLDIMRDTRLCQHVNVISKVMHDYMDLKLKPLKSVCEIRTSGLMIGIQLNVTCTELVIKALDKGLVINVTKENTIRLLPPLICNEKHLLSIVDILEELLRENYE